MSFFVYILKCADGKLYTGQTNNLERRLKEHQSGRSHYTRTRRPVEMIFYHPVKSRNIARQLEVTIKKTGARHWLHMHALESFYIDILNVM